MSKVSINLLIYNGKKYLPYCLKSIFHQSFKDFELLIIDNASNDDSVYWLKKNYPQIKILLNQNNLGFASGHNLGIKKSTSELLLLLNQDIYLESNFLEILVKTIIKNDRIAAIQGKLLHWNFSLEKQEKPILTIQGKTNIIDSAGLLIYKSRQAVERGQEMNDGQFDQTEEIFGVNGACSLYRRQALEDIKIDNEYFDQDFFYLKEDVDLAWRLRLRSWQSWYQPQAIAYHKRISSAKMINKPGKLNLFELKKSRKQKSRLVRFYSFRNHYFVLIKNQSFKLIFYHFWSFFFFELGRLTYGLIFEPFLWPSLWQIIKLLPSMLKKRKTILNRQLISNKELSYWFK